jgi:ribosomal protein L11 methyltransferase
MNQRALWRLSVTTSAEAEEAVTELLSQISGETACSYRDAKTDRTEVMVFLKSRRAWPRTSQAALRAKLRHLKNKGGVASALGRISLKRMPRRDWAEAWKRHFKPITVGAGLLIKPSWDRSRPKKGQKIIILDPGLSFGTGHHPTTRFCLHQIAQLSNSQRVDSFLDIGTGTGILAIAAAKLGYKCVDAFDLDQESIRAARANARTNGVSKQIHFWQNDLTQNHRRPNRKYSLVCANLLANLLLAQHELILAWVKKDGLLVVSGILESEFSAILDCYCRAGLRLAASKIQKEWRSGIFEWER